MARGLRSNRDNITTRQLSAPATGPAPDSSGPTGQVALASLKNADDLKAIEALSGTSGSLHKTAANTWALRQALHTTDTPQFAGLNLTSVSPSPLAPSELQPLVVTREDGIMYPSFSVCSSGQATHAPVFLVGRGRGTYDSSSPVQANDWLGAFEFRGFTNGTTNGVGSEGARYAVQADENWGSTVAGVRHIWQSVLTGGTTLAERMRLSGQGNLLVGTTVETGLTGSGNIRALTSVVTPLLANRAGDLTIIASTGMTNLVSGGLTLVMGADNGAITLTDVTNKRARLGVPSYTLAEEPVGIFDVLSTATNNTLNFGGGTTSFNAATLIDFYTASAVNTQTGTFRVRISGAGNLLIGTTSDTGLPGAGNLRVAGIITTRAPAASGSVAARWALGDASPSSPDTMNRKVRIEVDGETIDLFGVAV